MSTQSVHDKEPLPIATSWENAGRVLTVELAGVPIGRKERVSLSLYDPTGSQVVCLGRIGPPPAGEEAFEVHEPELWAFSSPNLYRLRVQFTGPGDERRWEIQVALREIRARAGKLFLNGRPMEVRGISPPPGSGFTEANIERLAECGFNVLVLGEPDCETQEMADRRGILCCARKSLEEIRLHRIPFREREYPEDLHRSRHRYGGSGTILEIGSERQLRTILEETDDAAECRRILQQVNSPVSLRLEKEAAGEAPGMEVRARITLANSAGWEGIARLRVFLQAKEARVLLQESTVAVTPSSCAFSVDPIRLPAGESEFTLAAELLSESGTVVALSNALKWEAEP